MRLLLLNYEFPPIGGGASPVSFEIAKGLVQDHGFKIDVVTMAFHGTPSEEDPVPGLKVYRVPCWRSKKELCHPWEQATYLLQAAKKCDELISKNSYDLCHTHFLLPTGILAQRIKKKHNLRYIVTSHGSDVPGYNDERFTFLHKLTPPLLKSIASNATVITAPSKYLLNLINEKIPTSSGKVLYIPNGINTNEFKPAEKRKIILSTGRLLERKGFQHLIQAVSDEDIGYEVHICGEGPMRSTLEQLAKESKTPIIFHGWLSNKSDEYHNLLAQADIFVLASAKENASVSLLEAMSSGCAIITTNISGCPETVGDTAKLIAPTDINGLGLELKDLISNNNERKSLQSQARQRAVDHFDWEAVNNLYAALLNKTIQHARTRNS